MVSPLVSTELCTIAEFPSHAYNYITNYAFLCRFNSFTPCQWVYSFGLPVTLPAGYLGSSLIGAALIACGFDTKASKIACLVLAGFFLITLWWARRSMLCVLNHLFNFAITLSHALFLVYPPRYFFLFFSAISTYLLSMLIH